MQFYVCVWVAACVCLWSCEKPVMVLLGFSCYYNPHLLKDTDTCLVTCLSHSRKCVCMLVRACACVCARVCMQVQVWILICHIQSHTCTTSEMLTSPAPLNVLTQYDKIIYGFSRPYYPLQGPALLLGSEYRWCSQSGGSLSCMCIWGGHPEFPHSCEVIKALPCLFPQCVRVPRSMSDPLWCGHRGNFTLSTGAPLILRGA